MENKSPAEPLYSIIRRLRRPHSLRELMAACLRSIHMGDPFNGDKSAIPETPRLLLDEVTLNEKNIAGDQTMAFKAILWFEKSKKIEVEIFSGMPHCFYSFPNVFKEEEHAYAKIADFISRIKVGQL